LEGGWRSKILSRLLAPGRQVLAEIGGNSPGEKMKPHVSMGKNTDFKGTFTKNIHIAGTLKNGFLISGQLFIKSPLQLSKCPVMVVDGGDTGCAGKLCELCGAHFLPDLAN